MANLKVNFCGVNFENPFILPSGIYNDKNAYIKAHQAGAAGITYKSLTKNPREGNPPPTVWKYDCGVINSVGLRNPGIEIGIKEITQFRKDNPSIPLIVSVFSTQVKEFAELVGLIVGALPTIIELNLSCPNVEDELGKSLGMGCLIANKVVKEVKKVSGSIPVLAKLTPNVSNIAEIAKGCEDAGVDGIVAINTVGPGMIIDIKKKKPVIGAKKGGVSGSGIFPVALRCVYEIYDAVKIPILGMGGVTSWQDVVQMIMAGATLVGVGSATYVKGMNIYDKLKIELSDYIDKEGIKDLKELVGTAHS
jgi:dihydroorotate dehydrogenase (NAD+) catalytic subunit